MPRGQPHLLQVSSDLVHWDDLSPPLVDASEFTDALSTFFNQRFYKATKVP
jgi:hypothetical protein